MIRILDRYIIKELIVPFVFGIFILTFLILIHQLLKLMELVIDKGVDLLSVGQIFLSLLPSFFLLTIPMAVLLASIMTFNRLSYDNEVIALKSVGVGFYRLLRPVLFFSVIAAFLTLYMGSIAQPWGGGSFNSLAMRILKKRASVGIEEGKFNGTFSNIVLYVESMPTFNEMHGVFIYDQREPESPKIIIAQKGVLLNDPASSVIEFRLLQGSLHLKSKEGNDYQRMTFATYDLRLDLSALVQGAGAAQESTPSYEDLQRRIAASDGKDIRALRLLSEFYKNFSFSLASFVFGLVGAPLGIISGRTGRLGGFTVGIGLITLYYLLNTLGDYLITAQVAPPLLAVWVPHAAIIPLTLYLLQMMASESYPKLLQLGNKRP